MVCEYSITSDKNPKLWKQLLKERAGLLAKCRELSMAVASGGSHGDAGATIGDSKSADISAETATARRKSRSKVIEQLRSEGDAAGLDDMEAMWKLMEVGPGV